VESISYTPPDSVVVNRIQRAFPSDELRERARATNLVERERKFDIVALFYTLLALQLDLIALYTSIS